MTLVDWIWTYGTQKEKEFEKMFDSNEKPFFNDPKCFETYVEKIPIGMKRKYIYYEPSYWEHLKIVHFLDPMHILKMFNLLYGSRYHRKK